MARLVGGRHVCCRTDGPPIPPPQHFVQGLSSPSCKMSSGHLPATELNMRTPSWATPGNLSQCFKSFSLCLNESLLRKGVCRCAHISPNVNLYPLAFGFAYIFSRS
ncbi:hypothetical protein PoB_000333400 [Plakobranchus ocellatus]|uniref:Uncharacterized protein n=1 Tax=Plakobranchus ocellatus TaxID=259542 RepID=A0AAV3Y1J2_9GAST|nr:hypothetical protein PoB_000333400 [Plakobranchus ocellatus]